MSTPTKAPAFQPAIPATGRVLHESLKLLPTMTRARLAIRDSSGWLDVLTIGAITIATWALLTLASGTWMFYELSQTFDPNSQLAQFIQQSNPADGVTSIQMGTDMFHQIYLALAFLACCICFGALIALSATSTRLGLLARSQRLATLRLIGVDATSVTVLALVEAVFHALIGLLLGTVIWLVSLPAWGALTMLGEPIRTDLMRMPLWLVMTLLTASFIVILASAALGIRSVIISPLGVTRRALTPRTRVVRIFLLIGALVFGIFLLPALLRLAAQDSFVLIFIGIFIAFVLGFASLTVPLFLRYLARLLSRFVGPAGMIAMHRIDVDPRPAARSGSGLLVAFFAATVSGTTLSLTTASNIANNPGDAALMEMLRADIETGLLITICIVLLCSTALTFIHQCSSVYELQHTVAALSKLGAPVKMWQRMRLAEAVLPLVVCPALGFITGLAVTGPLMTALSLSYQIGAISRLLLLIAAAFLLVYGSTLLLTRLQLNVLARAPRSRD